MCQVPKYHAVHPVCASPSTYNLFSPFPFSLHTKELPTMHKDTAPGYCIDKESEHWAFSILSNHKHLIQSQVSEVILLQNGVYNIYQSPHHSLEKY